MSQEERDATMFIAGMLAVLFVFAVFRAGFVAGRASAPAAVEAIEKGGGR